MRTFLKRNMKSLVILAAAAALIIAGLVMEQNAQVLSKAVRVCLECIGVG